MKNKRKLTEDEKRVIENLGDSLYTVEYVEDWLNFNEDVFTNTVGALNCASVKGFLVAVDCIVKNSKMIESEGLKC